METLRSPFQGVKNILRFNWHFYLGALLLVLLVLACSFKLPTPYAGYAIVLSGLMAIPAGLSILISYYIYDYTRLYQFDWMQAIPDDPDCVLVNIHAGFDETSSLIQAQFPQADLQVLDFYDPHIHTEISIKRARKAYPPFPGTQEVETQQLPIRDGTVHHVFLIFAAHEIRDQQERIGFFREIHRILKDQGEVWIVEHLRDKANFLAYTIGFFHFLSEKAWYTTISSSGFRMHEQQKINPFVTLYRLHKYGNSS